MFHSTVNFFLLVISHDFLQGCTSRHDPFVKDYAIWTAFRTVDYGYTRMTIHNKTHISIEQVSVDNVSVTK